MLNSRIAKAINVSPSTVSREIRRNSGVRGRYNWETAQANAVQTKRRKPGNRSIDKDVMEETRHLLVTEQWSPERISGVLAKDGKYISHETIYRMIRKDKAEGGTLYRCVLLIHKDEWKPFRYNHNFGIKPLFRE